MIRRLQILKFGQEIRNDGPDSHLSKKGTPTMGGIMILFGYRGQYVIMGKFSQSLCLVLLVCIIWLWCGRFC